MHISCNILLNNHISQTWKVHQPHQNVAHQFIPRQEAPIFLRKIGLRGGRPPRAPPEYLAKDERGGAMMGAAGYRSSGVALGAVRACSTPMRMPSPIRRASAFQASA